MKNFVKNSAIKVKNHVVEHKFTYAVIAGAVWLEVARGRQINEFLTEKGLMDEYYQRGEFEEVADSQ